MSAHIFVVEDEKPILTLLTYNLQKEGYKVSSSSNGEEALSNIKEKKPDLVLLDWMLPDLSGSSGCIVYFFCLKLEVLKLLFLLSDIPQPLDITLKAFHTKYVKAAEYIIGNRTVIKFID